MSSHVFTTLVCDVGGTNTTFALISGTPGSFRIVARHREATQKLDSFAQGLERARVAIGDLGGDRSFDAACISAAGPVHDRTVQLTNARWNVDAYWVEGELQVPVSLINDLSAISYAVPLVERTDPEQYVALRTNGAAGPEPTGSTRAVVAPGTGLGVGFLAGDGVELRVYPSEGGHSVMGDYDPETRRFRDYVRSRFGEMPDAETFVSGQGVANAADFVAHEGGFRGGPVADELNAAEFADRPAIVSRYAGEDADCARAMRLFKRMYGKFAANMALTFLPYAGLYLAGGVTDKNVHHLLADDTFMQAFLSHDNEAIREPLSRVPVGIIRNYDVSLFGCAHCSYLEAQRGGRLG